MVVARPIDQRGEACPVDRNPVDAIVGPLVEPTKTISLPSGGRKLGSVADIGTGTTWFPLPSVAATEMTFFAPSV